MSYHSEHQRMKPVLDLARKLDIASNPSSQALFEAGNGGFQVWCIPQDRPRGWSEIPMHPDSFSKPCQYIGSVHWKWEKEKIVGLEIETTAFALADHQPSKYNRENITNRQADIEWLREKVSWLFAEAGVPLPPFHVDPNAASQSSPYVLAQYSSQEEEYVVIVSSEFQPEAFCRPGYELVRTLGIGNASLFPINSLLRPEGLGQDLDIESDEGPLVEQYENSSRLHDDDWLEASFEDSISGWED
jgi:hypothetical protein